MKISEMTWEQGEQAMKRLAAPIANICDDEKIADVLKEFWERRNLPNIMSWGKMVPQLVTACLVDHHEDLFEIIETLLEIPKAEIPKHNYVKVINGLQDSWDEVLRSFFIRSRTAKKNAATE